jgi:hypothetical protein
VPEKIIMIIIIIIIILQIVKIFISYKDKKCNIKISLSLKKGMVFWSVKVCSLLEGLQFWEKPDASFFRSEETHVTSCKIVIVNIYIGVRASNFPDPKRTLLQEFSGKERTLV